MKILTKETPDNTHTFKNFISIYKIKEMSKKLTTEEFIKNAIKIHGEKYDYSLVNYLNNHTKVKIICPIHGQFEQIPNSHISKECGCYKCGGHGTTTKEFILKCIKVHGNKYIYSNTKFRGVDYKIKITCKNHGEFYQTAYEHLTGHGCKKCRSEVMSQKLRLSNEEFIKKANVIHGNKYDYSLANYTTGKSKINIICPTHGIFLQKAQSHLCSRGCPKCKESKGEKQIRILLENNNIKYEFQKKFSNCINVNTKRVLPIDFYLPDNNLCIEFNGKQHYGIKNGYFGSTPEKAKKSFERLKENDKLKKDYCKNNNIQFLTIKYNENIERKLKKILKIT